MLLLRGLRRSLVDPATFDPFDPWWWRSAAVVLTQMEADDRVVLMAARLGLKLSQMLLPGVAPEAREKVETGAIDVVRDLMAAACPWLKLDAKSREELLEEAYRKEVGDPDNPAFMAALREEVAKERRRKAEARQARGGRGDTLDERLAARDRRRSRKG